MKIGYARVVTDDQNPAIQIAALKAPRCTKLPRHELSGATGINRPPLLRRPKRVKKGDTLIVWNLDRPGRSPRDLMTMLDDLKQRGVKFQSLTEAIDTAIPAGRAMRQMISVLAEPERSLIGERSHAGAKAAKKRGVRLGRKPKLTRQQIEHGRLKGRTQGDGLQGVCGGLSESMDCKGFFNPKLVFRYPVRSLAILCALAE
jgi:DNA invertase Pin-like site-specific DNA recombinase